MIVIVENTMTATIWNTTTGSATRLPLRDRAGLRWRAGATCAPKVLEVPTSGGVSIAASSELTSTPATLSRSGALCEVDRDTIRGRRSDVQRIGTTLLPCRPSEAGAC